MGLGFDLVLFSPEFTKGHDGGGPISPLSLYKTQNYSFPNIL